METREILPAVVTRSVAMETLAPRSTPLVPPIAARVPIAVRVGTLADLPFVDALQKRHSRELGFLPTMALEGKVKLGELLVAEVASSEEAVAREGASGLTTRYSLLPTPIAYLIASDRYFKRDEVGYVTQINVHLNYRRSLVAATLLQAQFDRSAYGCRLYSCWCAQDLKANAFWESMGFTAVAFRTGSRSKGKGGSPRIHIFWQKRVRAGDDATPFWYPAQTGGGAIREDRLVFPIPPGVSWRDVMPVVLPEELAVGGGQSAVKPKAKAKPRAARKLVAPEGRRHGLWFAEEARPEPEEPSELAIAEPKPAKAKIDPRLTAMARELRDRWLETGAPAETVARHDVRRAIASDATRPALPANDATLALPEAA